MAVTLNANNTAHAHANDVSTVNNANLTIAAGSNIVLVGAISVSNPGAPSITSVQWDTAGTPQSLSLITSIANGAEGRTWLYGLVNPTTGNRNGRITYSGSVAETFFELVAFDGADQTGGSTTFANAATNTGTSTTASVAITSASGNMTLAAFTGPQVLSSPTQTQLYVDNGGAATSGAASYANGAGSVTHQYTLAGSVAWSAAGVNIVAASGGGGGGTTYSGGDGTGQFHHDPKLFTWQEFQRKREAFLRRVAREVLRRAA